VDLKNQSAFLSRAVSSLSRSTHDLESVGDDADSHQLLSVVAAVHHERVCETLDDGALSFPEALDGIAASGV